MSPKTGRIALAGLTVAVLAAGGLLWNYARQQQAEVAFRHERPDKDVRPNTPLESAVVAYNQGRYADAEAEALRMVESASASRDPAVAREGAKAQRIAAFSAARRDDMALARDRFAQLKRQASQLPPEPESERPPGAASPDLEEEAAYQHAVCTAALGDKKGAEAEYLQFMRDYPESPLVHGAVRRIEMLHDGHLPAEVERAWQQASRTAQLRQEQRRKARELELSQCGPECVAELLRRHGVKADAKALADEMKTDGKGTSMLAIATELKKRGFTARGLSLTHKGLLKQPVPLIALMRPGHYVLVNKIGSGKVTVWDPSGKGPGKPSTDTHDLDEWARTWSGNALIATPPAGAQSP